MANIDSLDIQIKANAQSASKALDSLVGKIDKLSASMGNLDSYGIRQFADGMETLSRSMQGLSGVNKAVFTRVADGIERIDKVNHSNINSVSSALGNFTVAMRGISSFSFDTQGLDTLIGSLSRLGYKSVSNATYNLDSLKTSLVDFITGLNGVGTLNFDANSLVGIISSLSSLGTKGAGNATKNLPVLSQEIRTLITELNKIGALNFDSSSLASFTNAISILGRKTSTEAVKNIPKLTKALSKMMNVLARAPQVSQNLIQMTQALAQLASQGSKVGSSSSSLTRGLNSFTTSSTRASKSAMSLASAFGHFYARFWLVLRALRMIGKAIDISSSLTEVENVVNHTFGQYRGVLDDFVGYSKEQFGMTELMAKQTAGRYQAMANAMGLTNQQAKKVNDSLGEMPKGYEMAGKGVADMTVALTKLSADYASFYDTKQTDVAEDMQAVFTGMAKPLRKYGLDLTEATLKEFALKNGLGANISAMSQAQKTMLRYQYVMANSKEIMGDFSRTADTWHNQMVLLKANFQQLGGIIGNVFVNALKPALKAMNVFMNAIIRFATVVSNALGKIFGWKYEASKGSLSDELDDASGYADDLASGVGKAGKAAKELKHQLQGFDELNNLTSNNDNGSGSGSGAGSALGSIASGLSDVGGKWVEQEKAYKSFIDDLYGLGNYISTTLTKTLNDIDWDSIYQGAKDFGKGLANFLNGLISSSLFGALGKTIASALNTAIYSALSFGQTFDFTNFGESLGRGVNDFFRNYDWKAMADTFNVWANGILDGMIAGLDEVDWELVGDSIGDFLSNLDLVNIASKLATVASKILRGLCTAIQNSFEKAPFETVFITIFGFLNLTGASNIIGGKILSGLLGWTTLGTTTTALIGIGKAIAAGIALGITGSDVINNAIADALEKRGDEEGAEYYREYSNPLKSIPALYDRLKDSYEESGWSGIVEDLKGANKEFKKEKLKQLGMYSTTHKSESGGTHGGAGGKINFGNIKDIEKLEKKIKSLDATTDFFNKSLKGNSSSVTRLISTALSNTKKDLEGISDSVKYVDLNTTKYSDSMKYTITNNNSALDKSFWSFLNNTKTNVNSTTNEIIGATNKTTNSVVTNVGNMATTVSSETGKMSSNSVGHFNVLSSTGVLSTENLYSGASKWLGLTNTDGSNMIQGLMNNVIGYLGKANTDGSNSTSTLSKNSINSFNSMNSSVGNTMKSFLSTVTNGFNNANKEAGSKSGELKKTTINNVSGLNDGVGNAFKSVVGTVGNYIGSATKRVRDENWHGAGTNLVQGLKNGIDSQWTSGSGNLLSHVVSLAKDLTTKIRRAFGIHSPSKVWEQDVGQYLPLGLARGLDDTSPIAMKSVQSLANDMTGMLDKSFVNVNPFERMELQASAIRSDLNGQISVQSGNITADLSASMNSSQSEQNALLRQQNELLTRILEKETGITNKDIFDAVRTENRKNYNQTGRNALVY